MPRVGRLGVNLALQMAVSDEEMLAVRYGSLLHDIGKLSTPHTDEETAVMRDHVTCGAAMLRAAAGRRRFTTAAA